MLQLNLLLLYGFVKLYSILLIIIYLAFISLGIPDAILGSAWPTMHKTLNVELSNAGIITMIIAIGTIISSFYSDKIVNNLGTAKVTVISAVITSISLFGFSFANSFILLCLIALPYGLGAGSVDAALNNFVAINFESKHMNWLHCFWGVGATLGPIIMGQVLGTGLSWRYGYFFIAIIQCLLAIVLFLSIPIWKNSIKQQNKSLDNVVLNKRQIINIKGVKEVLIAFFGYCSLESTAGLWATSYMKIIKGFSIHTAATLGAMFYLGITIGRFFSGFLSIKILNKNMIRFGELLIILGIFILLIFSNIYITALGLVVLGFGCAPIYPLLIHSTPENFGNSASQSIIGMQMASAYIGTSFVPLIFGFFQKNVGMNFYPLFLMIFVLTMVYFIENMNKSVIKKQ